MKRVITFIILFIFSFATVAIAKEKIDLNIDKETAIYGDEVTVSINFDKDKNNLYAYTAKLSYDEDVFEEIGTDNFEEQENWSDITYNEKNKKFGLMNKEGESKAESLKITLRVKDTAKRGRTAITVNNVTATNGENDISLEGDSVEVLVKQSELDNVDTMAAPEVDNSEEKTSVETNQNSKMLVAIPVILMIAIVAFLIYLYIGKTKLDKNKKSTITLISVIALLILLVVTILMARKDKPDIDTNGEVDYNDSKKLMEYLLEVGNPEEEEQNEGADNENANSAEQLDANLDGRVSTADVGNVLRNVKRNTKSKASVKSAGVFAGIPSNKKPSSSGSSSGSSSSAGGSTNSGSGSQGGQTQPTINPTVKPTVQPTVNPTVEPTSGEPTLTPSESISPTASVDPTASIVPTASIDPTASISPVPSVGSVEDVSGGLYKVKKDENIEFLLDMEITPATDVVKVKINDEYYEAKYDEEDGYYHVNVPTPTFENGKKYGQKDYTITDVVVDNGNDIPLDNSLTITVEVLKEVPTFEELTYNEANSSITLKINDQDEALINGGNIYIYQKDAEGNEVLVAKAPVEVSKLQSDETTRNITVSLSEFKALDGSDVTIPNGDYVIKIGVPYQLDVEGQLKGMIGDAEVNVHIVTDYKFDFKDLAIVKKSEDQTLEDIGNGRVKLSFTSTNEGINAEGLPITVSKVKVKIQQVNGETTTQEVTATGSNGKYEIEVPYNGELKQIISIESVELSNGRVYIKQSAEDIGNAEPTEKLENQNVTIFLNTPVAQSFTLNLGDESTNITAAYLLQDLDNTITEENVKLELLYKTSEQGEETLLDTRDVQKNTTDNTVVDFGKKVADYKDKIPNYDYNEGNGIYILKLYGTYSRVDGNRHSKDDETGFIGMVSQTRNEQKRKKEPTITAEVDTKSMPNKLTVKVTDPEGAFKTGTVTIKRSDGSIEKTENFTAAQNPFNLELNKEYLENGNYTIEISYTYQLKENEEPITKSRTLELNNFVSDYGVTFAQIDEVTVEPKQEGVHPGQILLKFTATTKTANYIQTIELDNGTTQIEKVERVGNQYIVTIPYDLTATKIFRITKLILDNGYAENLDDGRVDTVFTVYLEKPEIITREDGTQELELIVDENTKQPTAKVKIKNNENGTNYRARLTYPNSAEPVEISLTKGNENEYTGTFGKAADIAGNYKLEILADYDLKNGQGLLQNQVLGFVTKTTELEAKILNGSIQRDQPTKGETVTITYQVHDNTGKEVKYIEVNGQKYEAKIASGLATDNDTTYTVDVPVPLNNKRVDENGAPIVEFKATKLIYEDDEEEIEYVFEQKVQNAKPKYENTLENKDGDVNKPQMKFRFTDPNEGQKAFRKATVKLKDSSGNVVKTREFTKLDEDQYFLLYEGDENPEVNGKLPDGVIDSFKEVVEGETYSIEVEIEYDVEYEVQGKENETPGIVEDVIDGLQVKADYNLKINTNQEETKVDTVTGKTKITFTSSNDLNAEIESVKIEKTVNDRKEYLENVPILTVVGNVYTIEIETNGEEESKHEYNITEVKLKTGVIINSFEQGSETKIITHLVAPTATLTTPTVSEDGKISTTLNVNDTENILKDTKVALYKKEGEQETWQEDAELIESNTSVEQEGKTGKEYLVNFKGNYKQTGEYTIKVTGNYERIDGKKHISEELANSNVKIEVKINSFSISGSQYANKNEEIPLNISVQDNTGSTLKQIEIASSKGETKILDVTSNQVKVTTPKDAGEVTYKATKLYYTNGTEIPLGNDSKNEVTIYVLKTEPTVEYNYDDSDVHNPKIKVKVTDDDGTLEENKVTLKVTPLPEGNAIVTQEITPGNENEITLPQLQNKKQYKVEIVGTYDLDNQKGGSNYEQNHNFLSDDEKIVGFQITDFKIDNINVTNVSRTESYAEITFDSTNNTYTDSEIGEYYVTHIMVEGVNEPIAVTRTTQNTEGFDTFTARIPYSKIDEYHEYKIIGAKVLGGKEFTANEGFGTFEIFKEMPTAEITRARIIPNEEEKAGNIKVEYKIKSGLSSITGLKIKVFDKDGAPKYVTADSQVVKPSAEGTGETIVLDHIPKYAGPHNVQLLLTGVNLNDGKTYGEKVLAENRDINVAYSAEIVSKKMTIVGTNETANDQITAAKGQEVQIDYTIRANRPVTEQLNSMKITATGTGGKQYKLGENNKVALNAPIATDTNQETATYRITVPVPQEAEAFEEINYKVETIQFDTDEAHCAQIPDNAAIVKVQKQEPQILSVVYEQSTRTISVKVQDEDKAITEGQIVVKDGETPIITKTFGSEATGENKIEAIEDVYNIILENQDNIETKDYKVEVTGTYDIGKGSQPLKSVNADIKIYNGNYDFKLSDVRVSRVQNEEENKNVYINFKSTNNHNLEVKTVIVLEQEEATRNSSEPAKIMATQTEKGLEHRCTPTKVGDEYQIEIPFTNENPKKYTITQVILDNTVGFDKENAVEFKADQLRVFKEKPIANELLLDLKNKTAKFAISDADATIKNASAVIMDAKTNKEIAKVDIQNLQDRIVNFPADTVIPQGTYKLAIKATYDRLDGKGETEEYIGMAEDTVEQELQVEVTGIETEGKRLYTKTDQVIATINVTDNTDNRITKFYVHCKPEEGQDIVFEDIPAYETGKSGTYTITTPLTPTTGQAEVIPGKRTCTVEKVEYENPEDPTKPITVQVPQTDKNKAEIEILKDEPTLSYEKQEKEGKAVLSVKLNNPDKADVVHVTGKADAPYEAGAIITLLKKDATGQYQEMEITDENNKLIGTAEENKSGKEAVREIQIEENGTYCLKVEGIAYIADRITNASDLATITKNLTLEQKEIKVVTNYDFKIENEKVLKVDRVANTATIEFVSSNNANEIIKRLEIGENVFEGENLTAEVLPQEEGTSNEVLKYKYTVVIPNITPDVRQQISFRKATLNDGKEITDIPNTIVIHKTPPNATISATIELKEGESADDVDAQRVIKGKVEIQDTENTITKTYINVVKPDGTNLFEEPIKQENGEFDFSDKPVNQKGDYTIQLLADYDTNCGETHEKKVIGEATVTINVDAKITKNNAENYYVEKSGDIKIHYTIEDNAEGTQRFYLNGANVVITKDGSEGQEEFVTLTSEGSEGNEEYYSLELKAPDTPQTYKVEVKSLQYYDTDSSTSSKAEMDKNDKSTTQIDVLKNQITISDYLYSEEQGLRFKLGDIDNAFKEGRVRVEKESGEQVGENIPFNKQEGDMVQITEGLPKLEEDQKYKITIEADYDRSISEDPLVEPIPEGIKGTLKNEQTYHLVRDYQFTYTEGIRIEKIDEGTNEIEVSFECSFVNDETLSLTHAYIGGNFYQVEQKDGRYYAKVKFANTQDKLELKLQAVKFSNGKILKSPDLDIGENGKEEPQLQDIDSVYAFLTTPTITEEKAEITEQNKIHADFQLNDEDKIVTGMKVKVFKADSSESIYEKAIEESQFKDKTSSNINFETDESFSEAGNYTVKLLITYNRNDGKTHQDEEIKVFTVSLANWARITADDRQGDNKFIEREEKEKTQIPVIYTIDDNEPREIEAIKLEGSDDEIPVTKVEEAENKYKAVFNVDTQSGEKIFRVNKVVYSQLTVDLQEVYETKVEILKQKPTVEIIECNHNDRTITFTINDPEDTITTGKALITSEDGATVYKTVEINSTDVDKKEVLVEFKTDEKGETIPTDKTLMLKVIATYSLDKNGEKTEEDKELKMQEIAPLDLKYTFELQDVKVKSVNRENTTAQLELIVKDNSMQMSGDPSQYLMQNFSIENVEGTTTVQKVNQDEKTGITTYTAEFSYPNDQDGKRQEYKINKVLIGTNEKEIEPKEFILFKTKPTTKDLLVYIDTEHDNTPIATFKINDPDNTLINSKVGLYEYKYYQDYNQYMDIYMEEKPIEQNLENSYSMELSGQNYSTNSTYTVKIEGQYDLADGNMPTEEEEETSELIGDEKTATTQFAIPIHSTIKQIKAPEDILQNDGSIVVDKAKAFSMYYSIEDNTDLQIKRIILRDKNNPDPNNQTSWTASKVVTGDFKPAEGEDDVYRIGYGGKLLTGDAGQQDLEIKEIQYDRNRKADIIDQDALSLKIRKAMPSVKFTGRGTLNTPQADLNIDDKDEAIEGGKVQIEVYGADEETGKDKRYFEDKTIEVDVNQENNIDFSEYGELPDGNYNLKIKGKYNLFGNGNENDTLDYEEIRGYTVLKGVNFTFENLLIYPELAQQMGFLSGSVDIHNDAGLTVNAIVLRFYKDQNDISEVDPNSYIDYEIGGESLQDWYGEGSYYIFDNAFLNSEAMKCIKSGKNPIKIVKVITTHEGKRREFNVNELKYKTTVRQQGSIGYFNIAEKYNIDKENKVVSSDLEGYVDVHDWEDYYLPGTITVYVYNENDEVIAEQVLDGPTEEEKQKIIDDMAEIDKTNLSAAQKGSQKELVGYHRPILFKNIPIAKTYRVEVHGKYNASSKSTVEGEILEERVEEGILQMKHRRFIGAKASPYVDARLNLTAKTRVGIEESQTYIKNENGDWVPSSYVGKGEEVKIEYLIRGNMDAGSHITSATINKQDVELSGVEGKVDVYETTVKAPEEAGEFDINLTKVGLNTQDYKFTVDNEEYTLNSTPVDVLTETPKINDFQLDYGNSFTPKLTFDITEEKGEEEISTSRTIKKAAVNVYNYIDDNNESYKEQQPVRTYEFDKIGDAISLAQEIELDGLETGTEYWLQIETDYSLVENTESEVEGITKFSNAILYSSPLIIQADDNVKVTNLSAPEKVEKNQEIELKFNFQAGDTNFLKPVKLKVKGNNTLFNVIEEDGKFKADVTGYSISGNQTVEIEEFILNTGKVVKLPDNQYNKVTVEVYKDIVGIKDFSFTESGNQIILKASLKDREGSLVNEDDNVQFEVYEEGNDKQVENLKVENTPQSLDYTATFNSSSDIRKYKCIIKAKYSKLQDGSNAVTDQIYSREFSLDDRTIEIKDITNIELMKFENGVTTSVEGLTFEELRDGAQYLIRVSMANASTFYSDISYYEVKDGKLILTLDYVGAKQYTNGEQGSITIELKDSETKVDYKGNQCTYYVSENSFTGLIYLLRNDPNREVTLNTDLDALGYVGDTDGDVYINKVFTGKIHGNGHTIKNLSMPLFKETQGAEIENLNIDTPTILATQENTAVIARTGNNTKVKRVKINGARLTVKNHSGTMFATANGGTVIEECEVTGMMIQYAATYNCFIGGLVDNANGATIKNCRVEGILTGSYGWYGLGGIVGSATNVVLESCVSNVDVFAGWGSSYSVGNVIGNGSNNLIMKNCASVADGGNGTAMLRVGQGINESVSTNNYACSALGSNNSTSSKIKYQSQSEFTEEFYRKTLQLDENVWDLAGCGGENLPKLKTTSADNKPASPNVEIPEYGRIKDQEGYDQSKEILYHNLSKLAPYYDASYIIQDAKDISNTDELNQKMIQGILPIDKAGKVINSLTNENYQNIEKIKLVFKDRSIKEYNVTYETYFGNVVCYKIPNLYNIKYNYKNYVINKDATVIKDLTNYIENLNYLTIDNLTKTKDSRLYIETFDDSSSREDKKYSTIFNEATVKQEAEQVIIDLLSNNNYNITNDDIKTASVIKNEILSNNRLEKYLLTYTYFKRWYNINVEDYNLKDILLYHSDIFEGGLNYDSLTNRLLLNDSNLSTSATHTFYANNIGNTIGLKQIGDFIEYFIKNTDKYRNKNVNDWLTENFNGFILETRLDNQDDRLRYRAWDYLKCWPHTLLPILRVPPKSAYIYSCPTQIHIGATRVYYADPVKNADAMKKKIENFAYSVKKNYETIYGMIGGGSSDDAEKQKAIDLFNRKNDIQTDTNIAYDGEYVGNKLLSKKGWQYANKTMEDYHKWFAEATGIWTARIGAAAYAYGTRIYWEDNALLDNFKIWSHETMHDQDGALILKNHNRRPAVGGEAYSDGFLTQSYEKPGYCKFNFPVTYDSNTSHTVNWTGDRISSPEKVEDYYSKAFQLNYFLDYMIGEALFELDESEQEKVLSKMPDTQTTPARAGKDFKKVTTIEELIDGQYAIDYGAEGYRTIRWYNPLSDVNYTSLDNLWVMAYEMLGYAGYDNGWLLWATDILKTPEDPLVSDQNALKEITRRKTNTAMDIKEYKRTRFDEAKANADKLSYMNKDDIKKQFVETLKQDASAVKSDVGTLQMAKTSELKIQIFNKFKKYTDDLRSTPFGKQANNEEVTVTDGKQFIDEITKNSSAKIKLGADIDLSNYTTGTSIIRSTFAGEIKGENKKITGVKVPIFESTLNAKFENFTIENPEISIDKSILGTLSNTTEKSTITGVKVKGGTVDSKGKDTVGGLVGQPQETTFDGCSIEATTVKGAKNVGGLIGNATNVNNTSENSNKTTVKNSYSYQANIEGTTKVGGLIGNLEKYAKVEMSSSLDTNVNGTQDSIGGLVGEINKGTIENSYSTGAVTGKRNYCGGLVGYATDPEIKYCYTTCTVKGQSNIGGFIGTVRNSGKIENSISLAVMENANVAKFDTGSNSQLIENGFKNNYEIVEFVGRPSSNKGVKAGNIMAISYKGAADTTNEVNWLNGLDNAQFWDHDGDANKRDYGVKFDNTIWKIPTQEELSQGQLPTLSGKGNPENTVVKSPVQVQTIQEEPQGAAIISNEQLTIVEQQPKVTEQQKEQKSNNTTKKATSNETTKKNNTTTNNVTTENRTTSDKATNNVINSKKNITTSN